MKDIKSLLLKEVSDIESTPEGAYNIRENGKASARHVTDNINIVPKPDGSGIDIIIKPFTKNESVYIPAIITKSGINDFVKNDFFIGEEADIVIIAGCGVHNDGSEMSLHQGEHRFFVKKNASVKYIEKHIGTGEGTGKRIINPKTYIEAEDGSLVEMETTQIAGVDSTERESEAVLHGSAKLIIKEKILTHKKQWAKTSFKVSLDGEASSANLISRSVAKDDSEQLFLSKITGNAPCYGHSECDAIIMDRAKVSAVPEITAANVDAMLVHEAAIGKIAGEQITKLMTLGLTEKEAEQKIIDGFLK